MMKKSPLLKRNLLVCLALVTFALSGRALAAPHHVTPDEINSPLEDFWGDYGYRAAALFRSGYVANSLSVSAKRQLATNSPDAITAAITWGSTATDFNANGSWVGGSAPGINDIGTFSSATISFQPNVTANKSVSGLNFTTTGWDLTSSGTAIKLTLLSTATGATGAINSAANMSNTIDAPIVLGAVASSTQTFTQGSGGTLTLNGVISSTNNIALSLSSTGTFNLNGANTYTGTTSFVNSTSTVGVGNKSAFGTSTVTIIGNSWKANVDLTGVNKLTNAITLSGSPTFKDSGAFGLEFGGNVDLGAFAGNRTITSQISGGLTFSGNITNGFGTSLIFVTTNNSVVTLSGTNTYTGNTTFSGTGKLSVSTIGNANASGNVGAGTTINLGSNSNAGTLVYTGTGEVTTKVINLNGATGGATIDQSGTSGLLQFTANLTATGPGIKTLTLQGSNGGAGEIAGSIVDSTSATSLVKAGTNTWTLSGANTYTGTTTINASGGTLEVANDGSTTAGRISSTGAITVNSGGTLLLSGAGSADRINDAAPITLANGGTLKLSGVSEGSTASVGVGALTLTSGGIIDLAGTSLLHLAASGGQTWTGTLSIYNWSGSTSGGGTEQLLFGTDDSSTSLSQMQLDMISFYSGSGTGFLGTGGFAGVGTGEIVPVPEPSTWVAGLLTVAALGYTQRRRLKNLGLRFSNSGSKS
ncbi:MAG: autotransporter-associated beta strand repeat-containing protein [Chthoniobacterales bacterium]